MTVLVTGANGFIGSRFQVLSKNYTDTFIWVDRLDIPANLPAVDAVVHLAGKPGGGWQDCMESNILPTLELLRTMEAKKIPYIIFMSGGAVYPDAPGAIPESTLPAPTSAYGASKVAAETIIKDWVTKKRIAHATILRGNNIYGPGSDHGVVSHFMSKIKNGQTIEADGDGSQVREPVFVDDVIDIIMRATAHKPQEVEIYNVSGSEFFTLREMADHIARALGKVNNFMLTGKPGLPPHTLRLDISKAKKELSWEPQTSFRDGLKKTITEGTIGK